LKHLTGGKINLLQNKNLRRSEMEQFLCQSCGSHFPTEGFYGTNSDGSPSDEYCKYCWVNGAYGNPDETIEEMIESCVPYMVKSDKNPDGYPNIEIARVEFKKKLLEWVCC